MSQKVATVAIVVADYDEALAFYVGVLGFRLLEDTDLGGGKRWVVVEPPSSSNSVAGGSDGSAGASLLLAVASNREQRSRIGNQTGGRVFLFLETDDFERDFARYQSRGVRMLEAPRRESYGTVVQFEDLYGNRWDLIERKQS